MVEHNLAKVRVAGSSPVFRSTLREEVDARMVESVDTKDLKSFGHCGCAGSSPASSTLRDESCFSRFVSFFLSPLPVGYEYGSVVILGGLILAQSENLGDCVKILIFA